MKEKAKEPKPKRIANEAARRRYAAMFRIGQQCQRHYDAGTCPICGKPSYTWPDGVRRLTCKSDVCFHKWVAPGRDYEEESGTED